MCTCVCVYVYAYAYPRMYVCIHICVCGCREVLGFVGGCLIRRLSGCVSGRDIGSLLDSYWRVVTYEGALMVI